MKKIDYLNQMVQNFDEEAVVVSYSGNGYYFKPFGYIWTDYSKDKKFVSIKFKTINPEIYDIESYLIERFGCENVEYWTNNYYNKTEHVWRLRIKIPWETRF